MIKTTRQKFRKVILIALVIIIVPLAALVVLLLGPVTLNRLNLIPLHRDVTYVSMKIGPCFTGCPVYELSIKATGSSDAEITFDGQYYTCVDGIQKSTMAFSDLKTLADFIQSTDFFTWDSRFLYAIVADASTVTVDASIDGRRNRVSSSYGEAQLTPVDFMKIVNRIEAIPELQSWAFKCSNSR